MMPCRVRAFCHFGKWHNIEVEDDVTAYVEYPNGATGVFITTTADAPGTNRFEVTGTKGTLIFENNKLYYKKLLIDERRILLLYKYRFNKPECAPTVEIELEKDNPQHVGICNNVANAILGLEKLYAPASVWYLRRGACKRHAYVDLAQRNGLSSDRRRQILCAPQGKDRVLQSKENRQRGLKGRGSERLTRYTRLYEFSS